MESLNLDATEFESRGFKLEDVEEPSEETGGNGEGEETGEEGSNYGKGSGGNEEGNKPSDTGKGEEEISSLEYLIKQSGFDVEDEDFKELNLKSDSLEDIIKFQQIKEKRLADEVINSFLQADEDIAELVKHKAAGGTLDSFKEKKMIEKLPDSFDRESEDAEELAEKIYVEHFTRLGLKQSRIKAALEDAKDSGELFDEVDEIVKNNKQVFLKQNEEKIKLEKKERDDQLKQIAEVNSLLDEVIVKKGSLDGRINIPQEERKEFRQFLNSSKRDELWEKLPVEKLALIDYILFKDFNLKGLEKATKQSIPSIPKRKIIKDGSSDTGEDTLSYSELISRLKKK